MPVLGAFDRSGGADATVDELVRRRPLPIQAQGNVYVCCRQVVFAVRKVGAVF
jgi:hypothetical protein